MKIEVNTAKAIESINKLQKEAEDVVRYICILAKLKGKLVEVEKYR